MEELESCHRNSTELEIKKHSSWHLSWDQIAQNSKKSIEIVEELCNLEQVTQVLWNLLSLSVKLNGPFYNLLVVSYVSLLRIIFFNVYSKLPLFLHNNQDTQGRTPPSFLSVLHLHLLIPPAFQNHYISHWTYLPLSLWNLFLTSLKVLPLKYHFQHSPLKTAPCIQVVSKMLWVHPYNVSHPPGFSLSTALIFAHYLLLTLYYGKSQTPTK